MLQKTYIGLKAMGKTQYSSKGGSREVAEALIWVEGKVPTEKVEMGGKLVENETEH